MNYLAENIRFLRKQKAMTQADLAQKLGVNRSLIGAYEEGRSEPRLKTIQSLALMFKVNLQDLISKDISNSKGETSPSFISGEKLRILPIAVDDAGDEKISLIPQKAAAGYTRGYGDLEFIEKLSTASLPFPEISGNRTYRIFQIEGDSMLPLQAGSYVIAEYVENWREIKDNKCYVLLTQNDGVVYKRLENLIEKEGILRLKSDNQLYSPYELGISEILEVWKAVGVISFDIPDSAVYAEQLNQKMMEMMNELKEEVRNIGDRLK